MYKYHLIFIKHQKNYYSNITFLPFKNTWFGFWGLPKWACKNKKSSHTLPILSLAYTHSLLSYCSTSTAILSCMAQVKREVSSAGGSDRGQPGQAVWPWVGRTKLLADDQASDWLQDEPGALSVMYSMLSLVRCCSQGNRRGFLGFAPRVSQPAALCGILDNTVMCCDRDWDSQSFGWCIMQTNNHLENFLYSSTTRPYKSAI